MSWPRVAVVGAGAVGGFYGGMLARAGAPVTLIGRASHVEVWKRDGLLLDSFKFPGTQTIPVAASTEIAEASDAELVLFCVKSQDTEDAARQLARAVRADALVVSLQNGVDNVTQMRAVAPTLDPIAAVVYVSCAMPSPGRVKHDVRGELVIGDLPGRTNAPRDAELQRVAGWFEAAGVGCPVSPNVEVELWTKLIVNASLNPVSAVANITYGDTVETPESREMIRQLVLECVAVARASGVALPVDPDYVEMMWGFARRLGATYASTAQDLARGKRTEIDALNGAIVRRGVELGIPTPVNQALLALVKLREEQVLRVYS